MNELCESHFMPWIVRLILTICILTAGAMPAETQETGHWLTGYYATYNYSVMTPAQIDYTKLTHVIYWPVIPNSDGTLNTTPFGLSTATFSAGAKALIAGAHAAHAKALIGIGGDQASGASAGFSGATKPANLTAFVNNIVALMQLYGFDGVDINWEEIGTSGDPSTDNTQFPAFIGALRTKLNALSPHGLLTMAPAGRADLLGPIYADFDQLNVQTYVMSGPYCGWETWYNSPYDNGGATFITVPSEQLPSVKNTLAQYTSEGIPMSKLAMGIQFDSAVWTGGSGTSTGGVTEPKQTWADESNCGNNPAAPSVDYLPYRQMITTLATTAGYTKNFDPVADQSWLGYDPSGTGTTNEAKDSFVSYDSPQSIAKKGVDLSPAQAGVGGELGGVFIFELSGDFAATAAAAQQHPLLDAANAMQSLLPGLVTGLKATAAATSATLTWTGAPFAVSYNVFAEAGEGTGPAGDATNVTATEATIPGLTTGKQYYFLVEAVDAFGSGVPAQVSVTIPAGAVPGPISHFRGFAGNAAILLEWLPATGATTYKIYSGSGALLATQSGASYKRSGLTNGATYLFYVVAANSAGTSRSATLTLKPEPVPVAPVLKGSASNGSANLTWNAISGATSYAVVNADAQGVASKTVSGLTALKYTATGLTNGTEYYRYVQAKNADGYSFPSNLVGLTPEAAVPAAPTGLTATSVNASGSVTLKWTASAGATNAYSYSIFEGTRAGGESATAAKTVTGNATTVTLTGLANNKTYFFTVKADDAGTLSAASKEAVAAPRLLWVPDYDGELLQVRVGSGTTTTAISVALPACSPNSVAVNQNKAYVVCNANSDNPDKILVYDATAIRAAPAGTLAITPVKTISSGDFNGLIAIAFDATNNLWVASNSNNEVLEIPAAQLAAATPEVTVSMIDSPSQPTGLTFDSDGSMWITGGFGDGILLNFVPAQFGKGEAAEPRYCAVTDPQGGICISQANLFLEPEGVAVFGGSVWVANNSTTGSNGLGGATPGRQLVNLGVSGGVLSVKGFYGKTLPDTGTAAATSPFVCPGGLFASSVQLWVNDESYGETTPQCGANGDVASQTGAVFSFTAAELAAKPVSQAPALTKVTGRPGFGGIYVENDR